MSANRFPMIRRRWLLPLAVAVALAVAPAAPAATADAIAVVANDTTAYPTVVLDVDAPQGESGTALGPGNVTVIENGTTIVPTVTRLTDDGLEVVLAMDVSSSMVGAPLAQAKVAARTFLEALPSDVKVGLVAFGSDVRTLSGPTKDRTGIAAQIDALAATGDTRLYDAVLTASSLFTGTVRQRALVVLSDGADEGSEATLESAARAAASMHVEVVSLETPQSNALALARLAISGNGRVASAANPEGLTEAYHAIGQSLLNRYRVTYPSSAVGPTDVTVRFVTANGVLEATTSVLGPAAPAPTAATDPPAAPATAPEVAPVTVPVTVPATAAPGTTAVAPSTTSDRSRVPAGLLVAGALASFVGFALLLALALPRTRFEGRLRRRQLGLAEERPAPEVSDIGARAVARVDRFLGRSNRRERLAGVLDTAGIAVRPAEFATIVAACMAVAFLAGLLLGSAFVAAILALLTLVAAYAIVDVKAQRRRTRFAENLPDVLQLMTSALRTGYGLLQAIDTVAADAPEPAKSEFHRVVVESRLGRDLTDSLRAVGERMQSPDLDLVVAGVDIQRSVGGNLAEILDNVGNTVRERQRMARQIQALIGEGKLSAYILTALPLLLAAYMRVSNPDYFSELTHGGGLVAVSVSGGLLVVGWLWFQKLLRIKF